MKKGTSLMLYETRDEYVNALVEAGLTRLASDIINFRPNYSESRWDEAVSLSEVYENLSLPQGQLLFEYLSLYGNIMFNGDCDNTRFGFPIPANLVVYNRNHGTWDSAYNSYSPYDGGDYTIWDISSNNSGFVIEELAIEEEEEVDSESYEAGTLYSYSTKVERIIPKALEIVNRAKTETPAQLYIGIELECVAKEYEAADLVSSSFGDYVICKDDGSLPDAGFEIVTIPETPEFHRINMTRLLTEHKDNIRAFNYSSCGLHIHLNKRFFTNAQIGKMVLFVNHDDNYKLMEQIAQRDFRNHSYALKQKVGNLSECMEGDIPKDFGRSSVNVGGLNQSTIEIRIFKGNTKLESMLAKIDFVEALSYFVKKKGSRSMTSKKFLEFLDVEPDKYIHLKAYLTRFGYEFETQEDIDLEEAA